MADVFDICDMVERMVDGFEPQVMQCLSEHVALATGLVREQMASGLDGNENLISPNYDNDPYFEEDGKWRGDNKGYIKWKKSIIPDIDHFIDLNPRPDNVPNLYINGQFYSDVLSSIDGDVLHIGFKSDHNAPDIVAKYGDSLLQLGPTAIGYFNERFIIPHIWAFFADCGYAS